MSSNDAIPAPETGAGSELTRIEELLNHCPRFAACRANAGGELELSRIIPGHPLRGSRNPIVAVITSSPDRRSARGIPFAGETGNRMIELLREARYGLTDEDLGTGITDEEVLQRYRIYRTSAVKCQVLSEGAPPALVVSACHQQILEPQLSSMPELRVLVPMGQEAVRATLGNLSSETLDVVGRSFRVKPLWLDRPLTVIPLPHPSPANPGFSIEIRDSLDSKVLIQRQRFQAGLRLLRAALISNGLPAVTRIVQRVER
jgi:uracil-DNA glycosylase